MHSVAFAAHRSAPVRSSRSEIPSQAELDKCRNDLVAFIEEEKYLAPLLIRLSWHDAGTYD
jgi:catalase (peroxidase I)